MRVINAFKVGNEIEVSFNLRGREWTSPAGEVKYFNTLEAWRLERLDGNGESIQHTVDTNEDRRFTFLI
jgi:single-strand DNA-binding protein